MAELKDLAKELPGVDRIGVEIDEVVLHARRDQLDVLLRTLRDDERFSFEQLMDICGVDWPDREERFDVVYNLLSVTKNQRIRVIVRATPDTPVPSCWQIWPVATWFEREALRRRQAGRGCLLRLTHGGWSPSAESVFATA